MGFMVLTIAGEDTPAHPLVPTPGDAPDTVELEPGDGSTCETYAVASLSLHVVNQGMGPVIKPVAKVEKTKASLLVTDQRIAVACSKFDKGNSYTPFGSIGVGVVAAAATVVSKSRAAGRRRGKMLVGHIRYGWLVTVAYSPASRHNRFQTIGLTIANPESQEPPGFYLKIGLPGDLSCGEIARAITQRAARYRLAAEETLPDDTRQGLERLLQPADLNPAPGQTATYRFRPAI